MIVGIAAGGYRMQDTGDRGNGGQISGAGGSKPIRVKCYNWRLLAGGMN